MSTATQELAVEVSVKMEELMKLLPPGYRLTLVARSPDGNPEAGMLFSDDPNMDAVIEIVRRSQGWVPAAPSATANIIQSRASRIMRRRRM